MCIFIHIDHCQTIYLSHGNQLWSLPRDPHKKPNMYCLLLRLSQNSSFLTMYLEFREMANDNPAFISRIIMGYEVCVGLASDIALFSKMKLKQKGCLFDTINEIQMEAGAILNDLLEEYFYSAFAVWKRCWNWCIHSEGDGNLI